MTPDEQIKNVKTHGSSYPDAQKWGHTYAYSFSLCSTSTRDRHAKKFSDMGLHVLSLTGTADTYFPGRALQWHWIGKSV